MLFPDIDVVAGTVTLAIWQSLVLAGLLLLLLFVAIYRADWPKVMPNVVRPVVRIGLALFAIAAVWMLLDRLAERDRADERRALDQRILEMSTRALAPGSPLGCLEPNLGNTIEAACEKAVFAGPETIAAATAYVAASLSLLADGAANGSSVDYDPAFAALHRRLEIDRFGLVAQVLAGEGCSEAKCEKFALFADSSRISANLKARTFENLVARNAAAWSQPVATAAPTAPAAAAAPVAAVPSPPPGSAASVGNGINFPSAASIPPVSIMTNEPPEPAGQAGAAPASAAATPKRPPPPMRATPRAQPASTPPPIQIGPPAANAGAEPSPQ